MSQKGASRQQLKGAGEPPRAVRTGRERSTKSPGITAWMMTALSAKTDAV